jgi:hypothetical protein
MHMIKKLALLTMVPLLFGACVVRAKGPRHGGELANDRHDQRVEATTGWDKLGERWVQGGVDHDAIPVGRADGHFRVIKLKSEHSALELFDVVVTFGDGSTWSPNTRLVIAQGTWTRDIDLPGGDRAIRRVDFRYGNRAGGGKAQLELWAR